MSMSIHICVCVCTHLPVTETHQSKLYTHPWYSLTHIENTYLFAHKQINNKTHIQILDIQKDKIEKWGKSTKMIINKTSKNYHCQLILMKQTQTLNLESTRINQNSLRTSFVDKDIQHTTNNSIIWRRLEWLRHMMHKYINTQNNKIPLNPKYIHTWNNKQNTP